MHVRVPLTFRIYRGDQLVRIETLNHDVIRIGKLPSATLYIDDDSVSRVHAIVEIDRDGVVHLTDLGSTRGTLVNGTKVNKIALATGDVIQLGDIRIALAIGDQVPQLTAPLALPVDPPAMADELVGAKSIEIAAMLGDSVVSVKHCIDPRSGRVTWPTRALCALGIAGLVVAVVALAVSIRTAARNAAAFERWTHVLHKPAFAFRPDMSNAALDWLVAGGIVVGCCALAAALIRLRRERQSPYYRIGTAPEVEQPVTGAPAASFPLVAPAGDDFVFNYGAGIDGEIVVGRTTTPLAELAVAGRSRPSATIAGAFELPIPTHARIRARVGQTTFLVSATARPRRHATPLVAGFQRRTAAYLAGSLAAHLGLLLALDQFPFEGGGVAFDFGDNEFVAIHAEGTQHEELPVAQQPAEPDAVGSSGASPAMKLAVDHPVAHPVEGAPRAQTREEARAQATDEGLLGPDSELRDSIASIAAGGGNIASEIGDQSLWNGVYGADARSGGFAVGRSGFGFGCDDGCTGDGRWGTIGVGSYGVGGRLGAGYTGGLGFGPSGRHVPSVPTVRIDQPTLVGGEDRSIIRRYIRRNLAKITYCYERELIARPALEGTITAQFFIMPNGGVQTATAAGFDAAVANCVADVIHGIEFPAATGGGGVQVNYPFTFHAPAANR